MNDTWNRTGRVAAIVAWSLFALLAWAAVSHAQTDPAADPNAAVADSTPPPVKIIPPRAGWLSDRMPLRPGDLVTVVVDEQTAARERVSRVADGNRNSTNAINAALGSGAPMNYNIRTGILSNSRDVGEAVPAQAERALTGGAPDPEPGEPAPRRLDRGHRPRLQVWVPISPEIESSSSPAVKSAT